MVTSLKLQIRTGSNTISVTVSRRLSVNLEVLYVDFSHPKPRLELRLQASENPGLSREPREAGVTACDGLGYLRLVTSSNSSDDSDYKQTYPMS